MISFLILVDLFGMLTAITLDDDPFFVADEVNDVRAYRRLPSELETRKLLGVQVFPEMFFRIGRVFSQGLGQWNQRFHVCIFGYACGNIIDTIGRKK